MINKIKKYFKKQFKKISKNRQEKKWEREDIEYLKEYATKDNVGYDIKGALESGNLNKAITQLYKLSLTNTQINKLYTQNSSLYGGNVGFSNTFTGAGGQLDAASYGNRTGVPYTNSSNLANIYRTSDIAKKVIDIPNDKATFKWRVPKNIDEKLNRVGRELDITFQIRKLFNEASKEADLFGGTAIIVDINDNKDVSEPIDFDNFKRGTLAGFSLVQKDQIVPVGAMGYDPLAKFEDYKNSFVESGYKHFQHYVINTSKEAYQIHRSRVIILQSDVYIPFFDSMKNLFWNDSKLTAIHNFIDIADDMYKIFYAYFNKHNSTVIKINNLKNTGGTLSSERRNKQKTASISKSINAKSPVVIDTEDDIDFVNANLQNVESMCKFGLRRVLIAAGLPEQFVFGFADTPIDNNVMLNFYDTVRAKQMAWEEALDKVDQLLELNYFGERKYLKWEWVSLNAPTSLQKADIKLRKTQSLSIYADSRVITKETALRELRASDPDSVLHNDEIFERELKTAREYDKIDIKNYEGQIKLGNNNQAVDDKQKVGKKAGNDHTSNRLAGSNN